MGLMFEVFSEGYSPGVDIGLEHVGYGEERWG